MAAAGFIIYSQDKENTLNFLTLEKFNVKKYKENIYDIPKGIIDEGERSLQAAVRELYEEANISPYNIIPLIDKESESLIFIKPNANSKIKVYIAKIKEKDIDVAEINVNPHSNRKEHKSIKWQSVEEAESSCLVYLKGIFKDAERLINERSYNNSIS